MEATDGRRKRKDAEEEAEERGGRPTEAGQTDLKLTGLEVLREVRNQEVRTTTIEERQGRIHNSRGRSRWRATKEVGPSRCSPRPTQLHERCARSIVVLWWARWTLLGLWSEEGSKEETNPARSARRTQATTCSKQGSSPSSSPPRKTS